MDEASRSGSFPIAIRFANARGFAEPDARTDPASIPYGRP
jgi:hypothetical protein